MAITIIREPSAAPATPVQATPVQATPAPAAPTSAPGEYTILQAIQEWAAGRKGTLMLMSLANGDNYRVVGYDQHTGKTRLVGPGEMTLNVKIGEREVPQYKPYWRD